MYKVVVELQNINILSINADDPSVAALNAVKLFQEERLQPAIYRVSVFNEQDDEYIDEPIHEIDSFYWLYLAMTQGYYKIVQLNT